MKRPNPPVFVMLLALVLTLAGIEEARSGGGVPGHTVFVVRTPYGGDTTLKDVKDALKTAGLKAHVRKREMGMVPLSVLSFEVVTKRSHGFSVRDLLLNEVVAGETVEVVTPDALFTTDLDDDAGILGPDDLLDSAEFTGPDAYEIHVELAGPDEYDPSSTTSTVTLGVLSGASDTDSYSDEASYSGASNISSSGFPDHLVNVGIFEVP